MGPTEELGQSGAATVLKCCPRHVLLLRPMASFCCYDYRLNCLGERERECLKAKQRKQKKRERERKAASAGCGGGAGGGGGGEEGRVMDNKARERWCMLRCVAQNNNDVINRTMLRFRPIAPKPVTNDTVSGNVAVDNNNLLLSSKRSKRKYVRVRKNNGYRRRNSRISPNEEAEDGLKTLQLLPEKTELENSTKGDPWCNNLDPVLATKGGAVVVDEEIKYDLELEPQSKWLNFKGKVMIDDIIGCSDQTVVMSQMKVVVESWVTVESVTDTCMDMDARGLGSTDVERVNSLDKDTCPGFISDGSNRVQWFNKAYKRMILMGSQSQENYNNINDNNYEEQQGLGQLQSPEIMVWLITKDKLPMTCLYSSFTTRVRLQYTWQKGKYYSKMVPCDVFRMDCGGFAWRLDVEAALSLGR